MFQVRKFGPHAFHPEIEEIIDVVERPGELRHDAFLALSAGFDGTDDVASRSQVFVGRLQELVDIPDVVETFYVDDAPDARFVVSAPGDYVDQIQRRRSIEDYRVPQVVEVYVISDKLDRFRRDLRTQGAAVQIRECLFWLFVHRLMFGLSHLCNLG